MVENFTNQGIFVEENIDSVTLSFACTCCKINGPSWQRNKTNQLRTSELERILLNNDVGRFVVQRCTEQFEKSDLLVNGVRRQHARCFPFRSINLSRNLASQPSTNAKLNEMHFMIMHPADYVISKNYCSAGTKKCDATSCEPSKTRFKDNLIYANRWNISQNPSKYIASRFTSYLMKRAGAITGNQTLSKK